MKKNRILQFIQGASLSLLVVAAVSPQLAHAETKKILFLAGQKSHANGEHEFEAGCKILAEALNASGLDVEAKVYHPGWPKDESIFNDVDACIVYADAGGRFGDKYAVLDEHVKKGMGIMFMHYGVHPKKAVGETYFSKWIGGFMDDQKSVNPHWIADLKVNQKLPIANGLPETFPAYDEFYYSMQFSDEHNGGCCGAAVTGVPKPEKMIRYINMWNKNGEDGFGKPQKLMWYKDTPVAEGGRGIGFVGGHYHRNWAIDSFRTMVLNAIVWTARGDVPKGGVPSKSITKEKLSAGLSEPIDLPTAALYKQKPMAQPTLEKAAKKASSVKSKKNLAKSPVIKATDKVRHVELSANVAGLETITLSAQGVDGNAFDWIDWVSLKFINAEGKAISVSKESVVSATQGWGKLHYDSNIDGKPISISGKKFEKGIGSHADSMIRLKVPKGAVKFVAIAGLDDQGAIQNGTATKASAQFSIINDSAPWSPDKEAETVSVDHFSTPKDQELEVTLWAQSPQLFNPTNMAMDHKGRVWVTEGVNYRAKKGRRTSGDRVMVLEDTNGDGVADKSHCFVQDKELGAPLGIAVFENKVIVSQAPNLIVYTDVNNDLKFDPKVDTKEVLLTGFQGEQHDHSLHSLVAGPDGKWYFSAGNCGGKFTDKSGKTFYMNGAYYGSPWNIPGGKKSDDGFLWTCGFGVRMNPDGTKAEIFGHGFRNSYEQSINSLGDIFQSDNDDVLSCRNSYVLEYGSAGFFTRDGMRMWNSERRPGQLLSWAHWRQDDPGTFDAGDIYGLGSPTGNVFYENGALGNKWEGTYLAGEAARNVIFGYKPKEKGASFTMERFDFLTTNLSKKFIGGDFTDRVGSISQIEDKGVLFRPSDISVGPDGALYVADWYDGRVGGHGTIDDSCSGAIYRIAPKGFKSVVPAMDLATTEGQIEALKSPAHNVRHLGFTRLRDNKEKSLPAVIELLSHPNKYVAARAVWLLPYLGEQGMAKCAELLKSDSAEQRLVALRALRRAEVNVLPYARLLATDKNTAVRRDVAISLRQYGAEETLPIFVELAKAYDGKDKNYLEAIGLGAENKESEVWLGLKKAFAAEDPTTWSENFTKITWRLWPVAAIDDLKVRGSSAKLTQEQRDFAVESLAFINDKKSALAMLELAADGAATKKAATYWLLKRGTGVWNHMGLESELKERGIYDPETVVINSVTVPEPAKESKLPTVAEISKLKGDATKGKSTIMRCTMCHNINGVGPDYGPALKGWGATQSREAIIKSILQPSADIAHGFGGREITLKDGKKLQGLVVHGDPLIVTSTGGISQMVPQSRVESSEYMKRSLMMSAEQLGLTAQDVADITTFMQQWK